MKAFEIVIPCRYLPALIVPLSLSKWHGRHETIQHVNPRRQIDGLRIYCKRELHSLARSATISGKIGLHQASRNPLTDDELSLLISEAVLGNLQIQRSGSTADTSRDIVVRSVAWAVPASVVSCLADRHTSEMSADTQHDEPFGCIDKDVPSQPNCNEGGGTP